MWYTCPRRQEITAEKLIPFKIGGDTRLLDEFEEQDKIQQILYLVGEYHRHKACFKDIYLHSEDFGKLLNELRTLEFVTGFTPSNSPTRIFHDSNSKQNIKARM